MNPVHRSPLSITLVLAFLLQPAPPGRPDPGDLDPTFGGDGRVVTNFPLALDTQDFGQAVALDASGRIVVAGFTDNHLSEDFAVARFSPDGSLDSTFGGDGTVTTNFDRSNPGRDGASAVAVQRDGRIVVGGWTGRLDEGQEDIYFALARYLRDGSLDSTFGTDGKVVTNFGGSRTSDSIEALALDSDGRIVAAGYGGRDFAVARYLPDGTLDGSFGIDGRVTTDFGGISDGARAVTLQPDGRIVAVGSSDGGFAVARYERDGRLDPSFGDDGRVVTGFGPKGGGYGSAVAVQPDGRIAVAGSVDSTELGEAFAIVRYLPGGALDPTFGDGGRVITPFGDDNGSTGMALQENGEIVVSGWSDYRFALARYRPNGRLDPTFGIGGRVMTPIYDDAVATGVALQGDGRIVAAGYAAQFPYYEVTDLALARYRPDGSLDPTFGRGGTVTANVGTSLQYDAPLAVAIQPDGRIVAAGSTGPGGNLDFALARYLPDGTEDPSFGDDGRVTTTFGSCGDQGCTLDIVNALVLQPGGRIVAVGETSAAFALARYTQDGNLDRSFGDRGLVTTHVGWRAFARAAVGLPDGRIVAAGYRSDRHRDHDFALARYTPEGRLDRIFGGDGTVTTSFGQRSVDHSLAIGLQPDGRLLVAGYRQHEGKYDFALARYETDGALDTSFGTGGRVVTDIREGSADRAYGLALQPDGGIVVAGSTQDPSGNLDFALVRYRPDGTLDEGFGAGGIVTTDIASGRDVARAVGLEPDGMIVVVGASTDATGNPDFAIARYDVDGALDVTFGEDGVVTTGFGSPSEEASDDRAHALAIQPDGRILVTGRALENGNSDFALARYQS